MAELDDVQQLPRSGPWDEVVRQARALRHRAGNPSYSSIGRRVADLRMSEGMDEHAARIATSTVHYAFRLGRTRINLPLVREIVTALDGDPAQVDIWVEQCRTVDGADGLIPTHGGPHDPVEEPAEGSAQDRVRTSAWVLIACVVLNLVGRVFVDQLQLPIYLDMVGTAVAAVGFGPWRGAAVGLATNVVGVWTSGAISLDFAVVNVAGGLLWGYGIRSWGMGRTLPRYLLLNLGVGAACAALSVPILVWNFGHTVRLRQDALTETLLSTVHPFVLAETCATLMSSCGDKLMSGFVALVVVSVLPAVLRPRSDLPIAVPG